jgi:hypothetical protein
MLDSVLMVWVFLPEAGAGYAGCRRFLAENGRRYVPAVGDAAQMSQPDSCLRHFFEIGYCFL